MKSTILVDNIPGDQYVDWVGVSSYPIYLPNGQPKQGNTWIDRFREIYDSYGNKKPIMVTEGAPSATVEYHTEQDVSSAAAYEIQRFYAGAARKYPNLKLIMYWSNNETSGRLLRCSLSTNSAMMNAYKKAISDSYYIGEINESSDICYKKVSETKLNAGKEKISCYINDVKNNISMAAYYINGKYSGGGYFPDYSSQIDFSKYAGQTITLKADFYNESNKYITSKSVTVSVSNEEANQVKPTNASVVVNGKCIGFDAYNIGGNNYFKLRDIAKAINGTEKSFEISWDKDNKAILLLSGKIYTEVGGELVVGNGKSKKYSVTTASVFKDGKAVNMKAYNIGGNNYFKLRDVCQQFDIGVSWNSSTKTIEINTNDKYQE